MELTKTREDLATRAAEIVTNLGESQVISADDVSTVDGFIDGMVEELSETQVVHIQNIDEIPISWFNSLAAWLANEVAPRFGRPQSDDVRKSAENRLKRLVAAQPTYQVQTAEYF